VVRYRDATLVGSLFDLRRDAFGFMTCDLPNGRKRIVYPGHPLSLAIAILRSDNLCTRAEERKTLAIAELSPSLHLPHGSRSLSQSPGASDLSLGEVSPAALNGFALASTTAHAADSARTISPSFAVTATVMFFSGMNTTSAYYIVFDPLCQ
jgi:hypothetical protein